MPSRFNVFNVTKGIGFGQERDYVAEIAHDAEEVKALAFREECLYHVIINVTW